MTLTSSDAEKVYDGTALTKNEVKVTSGSFAEGEGATYDVTGSQTVVGSSENTFTYTLNGNTKAENYTIETKSGTLTVTDRVEKYVIELEGNDGNKQYDGEALTVNGFKTLTATVNGQKYTVSGLDATATKTDVNGKTTFNVSGKAVVKDASDNDVTSQFDVTTKPGTLTISKRNVTLTSATDSKVYDGTPLTNGMVTVTGEGFVAGEVTDIKATGSVKDVSEGEVTNAITFTKGEKFNEDNYAIEKKEGKLSITPRKVTLTSATLIKDFDGTPLKNGDTPVTETFGTEKAFPDGEGVTYTFTGSQTNAGSSKNMFTYAWNEGTGNFGLKANGYFGIGQWMYQLAAGTIQPPVVDLPANATAKEIAAYEKTVAQWDALSLDKLKDYPLDLDQAAKLLDQDEWRLGKDGIRAKKIDGKTVALDLTLIYPEGNAVGDALNATLAENLASIGVRLTVKAVPMNELLDIYYRRAARDCDMIYLATNFGTVFDPSTTYSTDEAYVKTVNRTGIRDKKLAQLAVDMRKTEPGDVLSYCQKWVAFQERWTEVLPAIPVYSNVYFDFYTTRLQNYRVTENQTWTQAIVGATLTQTAE